MEGVSPPRGRIIIYSCGLTREQSSVFTRTFSRSQSLEIVSLLSAAHSVCACIYVYLLRHSFVSTAFSPENSPERTSRHLARAPLGVLGVLCTKGASRDGPRASSLPRNRIAPSNGARKIEHIVTAILGRLLTILLLQALSRTWANTTVGAMLPQTELLLYRLLF